MATVEPEHELIRRITPFTVPAAALAFAIGALVADADAGWSAAIGIAVISANFVAHGLSTAWAATISPVLLYAVGLCGFVIRLGVIVAIIALLDQTQWFSVVAFIAAVVPSTIVLLGAEMKLLSGRMQADMWRFPGAADAPAGAGASEAHR
ncbi:MAG: hypothetical protein M3Q20_00960 [Actinomycetota bacterium]|nr:hypothetical protein [Actinomycetota bacterium]